MFDHAALQRAFLAVRDNHGCAGVDGVTIDKFGECLTENLVELRRELAAESYRPLPLLQILVAKKNGEPRALSIPTVRDRVVQTALLHRYQPVLDREFEACSYGYRKGRSVRQAVQKVKEYHDRGYCWVVDADIDAFFDTVDHDLLLAKVERVIHEPAARRLIAQWLTAEIWDGTGLLPLRRGLSQGSPLSPLLANLFLDELDEAMLAQGLCYIRFADDFVILAKTPQAAREAMALSEQVLASLLLRLDEGEVVSFEQGFTYLGVTFMNGLLLTPFHLSKPRRQVLYHPPPFDIEAYLQRRQQEG